MESDSLGTFHRFPYLPPEIRISIWEETWPESRVFTPLSSFFDHPVDDGREDMPNDEYYEALRNHWRKYLVLHPAARMSVWLKWPFCNHDVHDEGYEKCPAPVALYVCHESRSHTKLRYMRLEHISLGGVWFSPSRDVLFLPKTFQEEDHILRLRDFYGEGLAIITNVLWHGAFFNVDLNILRHFVNVRVITKMLGDWRFGKKYKNYATLADIMADDAAMKDVHEWKWTIRYIDQQGKFYAEV